LNWFVNLAKWSIVPPQCRAWAFSLFSSFGFEYHHISYFVVFLNILDPLDSFMRPSLVWIPLIIEDFWVSRTCPLVWGVILANVIFQEKCIRLKGDYKWFFVSIVKRTIKDSLFSFQTYVFRIGKLCFLSCEYAKWFLTIHSAKTQLWSHLMVFWLFFRFF
jgi:hypothetical protein